MRGSISSKLLVCGAGVRSIMILHHVPRCLKSLLTCKIHKSALEYSIIRRYTNVVYYYYYYVCCSDCVWYVGMFVV